METQYVSWLVILLDFSHSCTCLILDARLKEMLILKVENMVDIAHTYPDMYKLASKIIAQDNFGEPAFLCLSNTSTITVCFLH